MSMDRQTINRLLYTHPTSLTPAERRDATWLQLQKDQNEALHPALNELMLALGSEAYGVLGLHNNEEGPRMMNLTDDERIIFREWLTKLATAGGWKCDRINIIIDRFHTLCGKGEGDVAALVFAENEYFLRIVDIAFDRAGDRVQVFHLGKSGDPGSREDTLQRFKNATGHRVLTMTPKVARQQSIYLGEASLVFLASPFLSKSWENRAIGTAACIGQEKHVQVLKVNTLTPWNARIEKIRDLGDVDLFGFFPAMELHLGIDSVGR